VLERAERLAAAEHRTATAVEVAGLVDPADGSGSSVRT